MTTMEPKVAPRTVGRIADNVTELIGNTPLVRLHRVIDGRGRRGAGQAGVSEPGRQRQGPHRPEHDRGGRGGGQDGTRHDHSGADERQHRHRPGHGCGGQGLPVHAGHARDGEPGAAQAAAGVRRRADPDAGRGGHEGRDPQGERTGRRRPPLLHPAAVREPGQPGRSIGARPPRRSGATRAGRSTSSCRASARAAP